VGVHGFVFRGFFGGGAGGAVCPVVDGLFGVCYVFVGHVGVLPVVDLGRCTVAVWWWETGPPYG
jgi:hypothetical protein